MNQSKGLEETRLQSTALKITIATLEATLTKTELNSEQQINLLKHSINTLERETELTKQETDVFKEEVLCTFLELKEMNKQLEDSQRILGKLKGTLAGLENDISSMNNEQRKELLQLASEELETLRNILDESKRELQATNESLKLGLDAAESISKPSNLLESKHEMQLTVKGLRTELDAAQNRRSVCKGLNNGTMD